MTGADELTILDKSWNVVFTGSEKACHKFVADCRALGLRVVGDVVHASKREIEQRIFAAMIEPARDERRIQQQIERAA